jgi:PAP2 superfamily protein
MRAALTEHPGGSAADRAGGGARHRRFQAGRWRGMLRYLQVLPVAAVLWALDAVARFRAGAQAAGLSHAAAVSRISQDLGGGVMRTMNDWLAVHAVLAGVAVGYYIVLHGLVAGVVGLLLLWRRPGAFGFHRNALIAVNALGLVVFWLYPVAPPRMLAGFHDVAASAVPFFSEVVEGKAAGQFAALPSLHVAWAMWVAVVAGTLLRRRALRVAVWLYPAATIADVLATANHFVLDVLTAPGLLVLAYLAAAALDRAGRVARWRRLAVAPGRTAGRSAVPGASLSLVPVLAAPRSCAGRGRRGTAADPHIAASLGGRQCPAELWRSRAGRRCQLEDDLVTERPDRRRLKSGSVVAAADGSAARMRCSAARVR